MRKVTIKAKPVCNGVIVVYKQYQATFAMFDKAKLDMLCDDEVWYDESDTIWQAMVKVAQSIEKQFGHLYCRKHSRLLPCDIC